jgi:hypothetical protein
MPLPAKLDADTIPVILNKQLGTPLKGDGELHLLAEMPLKLTDRLPTAAVTTAMTAAGIADGDATTFTAALTKRHVLK